MFLQDFQFIPFVAGLGYSVSKIYQFDIRTYIMTDFDIGIQWLS
ncbi:hypothetical protein NC99_16170 [Sunxiuqinia dokdonensis]|uniref:Uncharacterized protein n=1 Tax=Sunxiuqinia dokdonensis TaxID=1409788 RepID=A0A0L8VAT0_9BACT|nr:hypothetical protein NC99_16170 [Sunxiuqinia dokdonensis]